MKYTKCLVRSQVGVGLNGFFNGNETMKYTKCLVRSQVGVGLNGFICKSIPTDNNRRGPNTYKVKEIICLT